MAGIALRILCEKLCVPLCGYFFNRKEERKVFAKKRKGNLTKRNPSETGGTHL